MTMTFKRFATFEEMSAFALTLAADVNFEPGSYSEEASKRPQITAVLANSDAIVLRWYAFTEEGVTFNGPRAAREAFICAEALIEQISERREYAAAGEYAEAPVDVEEAGPFVIRSMSTTDANRGEPIRPYHCYLLPIEKRAGAWWTVYLPEAMKFATQADALAEVARVGDLLKTAEIAPADADKRGLPTFWDNAEARVAARAAERAAAKAEYEHAMERYAFHAECVAGYAQQQMLERERGIDMAWAALSQERAAKFAAGAAHYRDVAVAALARI